MSDEQMREFDAWKRVMDLRLSDDQMEVIIEWAFAVASTTADSCDRHLVDFNALKLRYDSMKEKAA